MKAKPVEGINNRIDFGAVWLAGPTSKYCQYGKLIETK